VGFLALVFRALFLRQRRENSLLDALTKLNLAAVLLATMGGFGVLFNLIVDPHIRCYNRIAVFLGFFALTAAAVQMQSWASGWGRGRAMQCLGYGLLGAVLVLGVLDQAPPCMVPVPDWVGPTQAVIAEQFRHDADFVARLEAALPHGAMIYQLPYITFPESIPFHRAGPYGHLRPYLHCEHLRWSFGSMRGRNTDRWSRSVATLPMPQQLTAIKQAGFSGILVNRRAFADGGRQLEGELQRLLGAAPLVGEKAELALFTLDGDSPAPDATPTVAAGRL
jgi:phosphoglycerol transferase